MKQKQLYLNIAFTAVAVVCVGVLLIYMAKLERTGSYPKAVSSGVSHTQVSSGRVESQDVVWSSAKSSRSTSRVATSAPRVQMSAPNGSRSIAPAFVNRTGSNASLYVSDNSRSIAPDVVGSSGDQSVQSEGGLSPVAQLSILTFQRSTQRVSNSGLIASVDEPFIEERPTPNIRPKVYGGDEFDEPFYEPIGDGLALLLLLAGLFGLRKKLRK